MHCSPEANFQRTSDLFSKQGRSQPNKPLNERKFDQVNKEGSKQNKKNQSRGTQNQSYINKILSAIDLLCDMRPIFGEEILETNVDEAPQMENNVIRKVEKESRLRFAVSTFLRYLAQVL
ncbi:hypothetical protein GE061_016514 [Apolygus lucorum]|uniref:Uncharacterized protein n=1 Tax=Apolygus lucorum TaxID=248454 RepID=A0A8S9XHP2_APOLU|nr:hypothetical protein GE061_016514 [Apolygus lucorum]